MTTRSHMTKASAKSIKVKIEEIAMMYSMQNKNIVQTMLGAFYSSKPIRELIPHMFNSRKIEHFMSQTDQV